MFQVKSKSYPAGIWCLAQVLLEGNPDNMAPVSDYLSEVVTPGYVNPYYPLFTKCELQWEHDMGSKGRRRQATQTDNEWVKCLVVGTTHYECEANIRCHNHGWCG